MPRWSEETPNELWARFFAKVRETRDGCLVWRRGTPRMWFEGKPRLPHRVHYAIVNGELPPDDMIRTCQTPGCCHSAHWKLTTDPVIRGKRLAALKLKRDMLDWEIARLSGEPTKIAEDHRGAANEQEGVLLGDAR